MMWNWRYWIRNFGRRGREEKKEKSEISPVVDGADSFPARPGSLVRAPGSRVIDKPALSPVNKIYINLGIDFGTSFTKVSFRDIDEGETILVTFEACTKEGVHISPEEAMIPSIVSVGSGGVLSLGSTSAQSFGNQERYLKTRLAKLEEGSFLTDDEKKTRALSSWFLATVILRSQEWIRQNAEERLRKQEVAWSANVGVPVAYCDSSAIATFKTVLSVAWTWAESDNIPADLEGAIKLYEETVQTLDPESCKCHPVPEVVAGARSFLLSRQAVPGVYVYFDVGGGTVDGVVFNYQNPEGEQRVDVYSAEVESLGVAEVAGRINQKEATLFKDSLPLEVREVLNPIKEEIHDFVSEVIIGANKKIGKGRWCRSSYASMPVFLGGGGGRSAWYEEAICSTHAARDYHNCDIPQFRITEVPKPEEEFDMRELERYRVFYRFAVAYGLSIPYIEGPEIKLPREIKPFKENTERYRSPFGDYEDSKAASAD